MYHDDGLCEVDGFRCGEELSSFPLCHTLRCPGRLPGPTGSSARAGFGHRKGIGTRRRRRGRGARASASACASVSVKASAGASAGASASELPRKVRPAPASRMTGGGCRGWPSCILRSAGRAPALGVGSGRRASGSAPAL